MADRGFGWWGANCEKMETTVTPNKPPQRGGVSARLSRPNNKKVNLWRMMGQLTNDHHRMNGWPHIHRIAQHLSYPPLNDASGDLGMLHGRLLSFHFGNQFGRWRLAPIELDPKGFSESMATASDRCAFPWNAHENESAIAHLRGRSDTFGHTSSIKWMRGGAA